MANVPNARRYRTSGRSSAKAAPSRDTLKRDLYGEYRYVDARPAQPGLPEHWASIVGLVVLVGFVVLLFRFPGTTLAVCGCLFIAKLLSRKK